MLLLRWVGYLLAIPLRLVARGLGLLGMPNYRLDGIIWFLGGDQPWALAALSPLLTQERHHEVLALAEQWNSLRAAPSLKGLAGIMLQDKGDIAAANQAFLDGRQMAQPDPTGMLDLLEFGLARANEDPLVGRECAIRLEQRRDLPAQVRRLVLCDRMFDAMLKRDFEDARRRAMLLLTIQDEPLAEAVLWALAARRNDDHSAARHLAKVVLPASMRGFYKYIYAYSAQLPDVEVFEQELREADEVMHQHARKMIEIWETVK